MTMPQIGRISLLGAGLALFGGCSHGGSQYAQPGATQGAEATPPEPSTTQPAVALNDAQILTVLETVDTGEIQQAEVARSRAKNPRVQEFARQMIEEHSAARRKEGELGRQDNLVPTASPTSNKLEGQATDMLSQLNSPETTNFDVTYMKGQVKQHQAVLDLIANQLLPSASNGDLAQQLRASRDMVQKHLTEAQQLLSSLAGQ